MPAPQGNRFWQARSSHGRKPIYDNSEMLWDACQQYFAWAEDNPLWEVKATQYQGAVIEMPLPKMRAMTISGMCTFLGIATTTWDNYKVSDKEGFLEVTREAEQIIKDQKFAGASADLLNANIIARDLGLVDKQQQDHKVTYTDMTEEELDAKLRELAAKVKE